MDNFPKSRIFNAKAFSNVFHLIMHFSLFPLLLLNLYASKLIVKLVAS